MKHLFIAIAATTVLYSCHSNAEKAIAIENAKKAAIDSVNNVNMIKQQIVDSMNRVNAKQTKQVAVQPTSQHNAAAPAPATAVKKKGWSHTAKGAVVGAGAGAITGAIVNKDRVKGAAIGTLIGAGVGAGTGAIVDHQKKKKQATQQ